ICFPRSRLADSCRIFKILFPRTAEILEPSCASRRCRRAPINVDVLKSPLAPAAKRRLVEEVQAWHHSIDLGDGVITPGGKTPAHHHYDLERLRLPDLKDKSVLDVGAWDGYYTFMAEGAGARRVVALDHYAW